MERDRGQREDGEGLARCPEGGVGKTPTNRRARYYRLTAAGRKQLAAEVSDFSRVLGAIQAVMEGT